MDYDRLEVLVPAGLTVNGALIALMQDSDDDPITAELRIDGPPLPADAETPLF